MSMGGFEIGFAHPCAIILITTGASVSPIPAGSYAYRAVTQWPDGTGARQLGQPSAPVVFVMTVEGQNSIQVAFPEVGQRAEELGPAVLLYRTTNGGASYQLLPISPTYSNGVATFVDMISDDVLAENEFIYTDGGVLPNVLGPSCNFTAAAEERLWCGGMWSPNIIEASKIRVPAEPINFTGDPTHQVVLPEDCTGLAYMDGQVVAFAEFAIYLIGGDGPNDQGAGSFLPPRLLIRGIGCIDYKSILETPIGILFQSQAGIYLIPRGFGSPQFIGAKVQDTTSNYPKILSAAYTSTSEYNLARFLITTAARSYGSRVLTLDIDQGAWFVDIYDTNGTAVGVTFHGFSEVGAWDEGLALFRYELSENASPIWAEDETVFEDTGAAEVGNSKFVARTIQTAWLYPFGPGGWGRINKTLLSMAHDYAGSIDTDSQIVTLQTESDLSDADTVMTATWTVAGSASTNAASYRNIDTPRRDLTSVRATITDSQYSSPMSGARGPKYLALTLEIGESGGVRPLTDTERT